MNTDAAFTTPRLSPLGALGAATIGSVIADRHRKEYGQYSDPELARTLSNPFTRRAIYTAAHNDIALADFLISNDPFYATRGKLNKFENTFNDIIVTLCLPLGSSIEFIIGGILNVVEGQSPMQRSKFGQLYDDIIYFIFDPFHKKRLLYDLSSAPLEQSVAKTH